MNFLTKLPKPITRFAGKMLMKLKNNSPELCIIGGLILGAGAMTMVGVQTWKHKDILAEDARKLEAAKSVNKTVESIEAESESENEGGDSEELKVTEIVTVRDYTDDEKKALMAARINLGKDILKAYWLPMLLEIGSIGLVWGGRTKLRKSLAEMTALYMMAVDKYKKLYERIRKEYGDEKAQELAYGVRMADSVDSETGEMSKVPLVDEDGNTSMYAFMFDEGEFDEESGTWIWKNENWKRNKLANYLLVKNAEEEATRKLIMNGWYLLGDLKRYLGVKPGPCDWRVGWWYKPDQENRVELGVFDDRYQLPFNRGFANPDDAQAVCMINPNVNGCIDFVFEDIEQYDFRCGRRSKKKKRMPTNAEMFGEDYARKLARQSRH